MLASAALLAGGSASASTGMLGVEPALAGQPPPSAFVSTPKPTEAISLEAAPAPLATRAAPPAQGFIDISMKPVSDEGQPRLAYAVLTRPIVEHAPSQRSQVSASESPDIFGSVALMAGRTPEDAKWRRVVDYVPSAAHGPWAGLVGRARALDQRARIEAVNAWVNRHIVWTADQANFGVADYWGTARESLSRGRGDCKDYAIAKMELLRALGTPADDLYFVVVRDLVRRADHAVLAVRVDGRFLILDSGGDAVMDSEDVRDYRPILTFSGARTWVHGYRKAPELMLASAADVTTAR